MSISIIIEPVCERGEGRRRRRQRQRQRRRAMLAIACHRFGSCMIDENRRSQESNTATAGSASEQCGRPPCQQLANQLRFLESKASQLYGQVPEMTDHLTQVAWNIGKVQQWLHDCEQQQQQCQTLVDILNSPSLWWAIRGCRPVWHC